MKSYFTDKQYQIEKFEGKGGWSYVAIDGIEPSKNSPFGWTKVSGWVDDYELKQYKLMPMGNNRLMLALKAEIRKQLNKKAGDWVHIRLLLDDTTFEIPDEILACLEDFPKALATFQSFSESNQKYYIDWINEAKNIDTKVNRINKMIDRLLEGKKLYDF